MQILFSILSMEAICYLLITWTLQVVTCAPSSCPPITCQWQPLPAPPPAALLSLRPAPHSWLPLSSRDSASLSIAVGERVSRVMWRESIAFLAKAKFNTLSVLHCLPIPKMFLTAALLFFCTPSASGSNIGGIARQVESERNGDSPIIGRDLKRIWGEQVMKKKSFLQRHFKNCKHCQLSRFKILFAGVIPQQCINEI